jgi:hypothetical protein
MGEQVLIGPSVYYPTPGTPLFERCRKEGLLPPDQLQWRSSAFPIETKDFGRLDLVTLFRLARLINFIKGKMDEKELSAGMTWKELYRAIKDRVKKKSYSPCDSRLAPYERVNDVTWIDLVRALMEERSFFSLRREPGNTMSAVAVPTSKKVLDTFFEKAWDKPILKSRNN